MISISYNNIENTPYKIDNTTGVNPFPMDGIQVQLGSGELMIYMTGHVGPKGELPGALVGFTLPPVSIVNGAQMLFAQLSYEMRIDEVSSSILECFESDLKWCINPAIDPKISLPNVVDGSSQKVYSKGGRWQIDNASGVWTNTDFKPGPFPVNQWNKVAIRQSLDPANNQFSFLSITDGNTSASIPSTMRPLPLLWTNWTATGVQFQLCLQKAGFVTVWIRNVNVVFSDTM